MKVLTTISLLLGLALLSGCDTDDHADAFPSELVSAWSEAGCSSGRVLVFEEDGSFVFYTGGGRAGSGMADVDGSTLTMALVSGYFKWSESTNNAPITFSFTYAIADSVLTLTFDILGETTTTEYRVPT